MDVKRRVLCIIAVLAALLLVSAAVAENVVSTTVVMRVSRMTQSAIVNIGEDLTMDVNIEGISPARYQWYFGDQVIEGATQKVFTIVNAQMDNAGTYRLEAFDDADQLVVSMEIAARVVDSRVPKSGDRSLPVGVAAGAVGVAAAGIVMTKRKVRV